MRDAGDGDLGRGLCDEHQVCRIVDSLYHAPGANITLCISSLEVKERKKGKHGMGVP